MGDYSININKNIIPVKNGHISKVQDKLSSTKNQNFAQILKNEITKRETVKFSKHAQERLCSRNVKLSQEDILKIDKAVEKAAQKGIKDTLILLGDTAFIANVKSKTIITAATEEILKENIFTNIDGAVIL